MAWSDLFAAVALLLVFEGIMPFLHPRGVRQTFERMSAMSDRSLRLTGFACMVAGATLLALVR